jgi:hemerythrin-like metal-binding protein
MPFYQWSETMSVGVALLDSDHKALIATINQLHRAVQEGDEPEILDQIFDALVAYVEHHFAREEEVMTACGYPAAAAHKTEHLRFAQDMHYTRDRYFRGEEAAIGRELLDYLKDWLNRHILIEDMAYRPYVEGRRQVVQVAEALGPGLFERDAAALRRRV